ncbi:DNA ligase (Polydeoxyribonucleotide synthase [ATP])(Lig(Tk)), related [Neospora caninum Liverpool]|uniref:DNA ligase n=1 Tax=Neospora caninum (strain Liverpool) TaxID=572307 RepID=F0V7Z4_NEOCL|nr:DNA ligase (Polydeoxyribonucleotide synthase [ATP])(Lig(Tk)), related [Neospora caninum Liverpool]CBZ49835.1 DNA ligase (Polydeoxyribonucleotide synthase [ATP])(Lig(Tk)), related [Neospora caninum Liverpool]|eukprot:XP_003879870.1 DNA ligase (Polydeoxyribonucleotide synthase [ATP])(Lig(Tk)), related [Neospora caninum Liverpool]
MKKAAPGPAKKQTSILSFLGRKDDAGGFPAPGSSLPAPLSPRQVPARREGCPKEATAREAEDPVRENAESRKRPLPACEAPHSPSKKKRESPNASQPDEQEFPGSTKKAACAETAERKGDNPQEVTKQTGDADAPSQEKRRGRLRKTESDTENDVNEGNGKRKEANEAADDASKPPEKEDEEDAISEADSDRESIDSDSSVPPSSQDGANPPGDVKKVSASSAEGRRALEMLQKKKRSPASSGKTASAERLFPDSDEPASEDEWKDEAGNASKKSILELLGCKKGDQREGVGLAKEKRHEAGQGEKKSAGRKKKADEDEQLKTGTLFACRVLAKEPSCDLASPLFDPSHVPLDSISAQKAERNTKKAQVEDSPPILFEVLVNAFDKIEQMKASGTGSNKKQTVILTNLFRLLLFYEPKTLYKAIYVCLNKVAPDYLGQEVGVGESLILKAMAETYGRTEAHLKKELQHTEDLGRVAERSSCKTRTLFPPPRLTIDGVFDQLKAISQCAGKDSQLHKRDLLKRLLVGGKGAEPKYIIRFLQQRMRTGASTATVYQALAFACFLTHNARDGSPAVGDTRRHVPQTESNQESPSLSSSSSPSSPSSSSSSSSSLPSAMSAVELESHLSRMEQSVRRALCEVPNVEIVVAHLLRGADADALAALCVATPGIPLQPMLARPTRGFEEVVERLKHTEFTCEFKYDGERIQLHLVAEQAAKKTPGLCPSTASPASPVSASREEGTGTGPAGSVRKISPSRVRLFSRNLEEITQKYPDIIDMFLSSLQDTTDECILDGEVVAYDVENGTILPFQTLTRRKRKGVDKDGIEVRVALFLFDCMRLNGECLLGKTLEARREKMKQAIDFQRNPLVQHATYKDISQAQEFEEFLSEAIEENATYEPSKRSLNWLKVKKDYVDGLTDSVDLVPIGACYGKGKRSGTFGTYLLAVYNPADETYQTVCKAATGFSEEALQQHHNALSEHIISHKKPYYDVSPKLEADVWFEACQVWECRAADLSISPVHTAGIGEKSPDKGIGLRFPRFLRVREDKNPEQATTSSQIVEMYTNQFRQNKAQGGKANLDRDEEEDDVSDSEKQKEEE